MRGLAIGMGEVIALVSSLKTRMPIDLQARFGWDATDQEQDRFEGKMMVFVWFRVEDSTWDRRRTLTIWQKDLADKPLDVPGHLIRINAKIALGKRPMFKAQTMWLNTMDKMGLGRDHFDIKWLATSWKVSVKGFLVGQRMTMILFATHSQGAKMWQKVEAGIDMEYVGGGEELQGPDSLDWYGLHRPECQGGGEDVETYEKKLRWSHLLRDVNCDVTSI